MTHLELINSVRTLSMRKFKKKAKGLKIEVSVLIGNSDPLQVIVEKSDFFTQAKCYKEVVFMQMDYGVLRVFELKDNI